MGISTAVRLLTGIVLFILLARLWGPHDFGLFMYWVTVTSIMIMLVDYGFSPKILREVGKQPEQVSRIMGETLNAKIALACLLILFVALFSIITVQTRQDSLLMWLLLLAAIGFSFGDMICTPFRALGAFHQETKVVLLSNGLHFILVASVAYAGYGLEVVAVTFAISRIIFLVFAIHFYVKFVGSVIWPLEKKHSAYAEIRSGWAYAIDMGFVNLYIQIDTVLIKYFLGNYQVGIYQSGTRILQGIFTFAQIINNVHVPNIAKHENEHEELKKIINRMSLEILILGSIGYLAFVFCAEFFQRKFFGSSYVALVELFPFFALLIASRYFTTAYSILLVGLGQQKYRIYVTISALFVLFVLSVLLIPKYQIKGLIVSLIASYIVSILLYLYKVLRLQIRLGIFPILLIGMQILISINLIFLMN